MIHTSPAQSHPWLLREAIERAVREVFEKNFLGVAMPYEQARKLAWLEKAIVDNCVSAMNAARSDQG